MTNRKKLVDIGIKDGCGCPVLMEEQPKVNRKKTPEKKEGNGHSSIHKISHKAKLPNYPFSKHHSDPKYQKHYKEADKMLDKAIAQTLDSWDNEELRKMVFATNHEHNANCIFLCLEELKQILHSLLKQERQKVMGDYMKKVNELYTEFEENKPPSFNTSLYRGRLEAMEKIVVKLFNINGNDLIQKLNKER